jgi:beta-glucosidase
MDSPPPPPKHDHATLIFPDGFLWGAGNSAFQVEGNNTNSDWWEWEQTHQPENCRSGLAADHYHRFEEDFKLLKELGHNAHRLSLEWSRIEPEEGKFDQEAIDHYRQVLQSLKDKNIKVMLTLHHFSNPIWLAKKGGWTNVKSAYYFERFAKKVVPEYKDLVDLWVTINEPGVYASLGYLTREFPPQKRNPFLAFLVLINMARAHKKAYRLIHSLVPKAQVAVANPVQSFEVIHLHSIREHLGVVIADYFANHFFYALTGMKTQDFIGLNYYQNWYIGKMPGKILPQSVDVAKVKKNEVSDLGWEIHPAGIFDVIMDFKNHKPIYITENGIATTNDDRRVRFLLSYLSEMYHAIQLGAPVKGYFYWSSMDNMELHRGFEPRFGLIEVDFRTQKRTPRPSAYVYREIIRHNGVAHHLLMLLGHGINVKDVIKIEEK